jgi:glucosamine kinase
MIVCGAIDGGQSSTAARIADEHGAVVGEALGPPADLVGQPRDSRRQAEVLDDVLARALAAAGLSPDTALAALVAGISGYDEGIATPPRLRVNAANVSFVHDATIAHAGALAGGAGILVLSGTGSVAVGCSDPAQPLVRAGGWGCFFGDEGSALWIARTALRGAMRREDRGSPSTLGRLGCERFGVASLRALQHAVAHAEIDRPSLAAFAPFVLAAAERGDRDALAVRREAVAQLAELARTVDERLLPAPLRLVTYAGGLFENAEFSAAFEDALVATLPHAEIVEPLGDPLYGALRLAFRAAGIEPESLARR